MITLYSGTPGSGKSLYASYVIWKRLVAGCPVISNFSINFDAFGRKAETAKKNFTWFDNSELSPELLVQYAKQNHKPGKESQTLIVIDECAVMFNSRDYGRKDRMKWIIFFQQHRKLGYDVVLIAQNDRMIDRQIRAFIEIEYKYRSVRRYKMIGTIIAFITGGLFVRIGYWYGARLRLGSEFFFLKKKKAKIYDTFEIFK